MNVNWTRRIFTTGRGWHVGDMVHWNGAWHIAFCEGSGHNSPDTQCAVLSSTDLENWSCRVAISQEAAGGYVAEPQLLVSGGRLLMYAGAADTQAVMAGDRVARSWMLMAATRDGETWSRPRRCYAVNHDFWHPVEHNGRYFLTADNAGRVPPGPDAKVDLLTSGDGGQWAWVSEVIRGSAPGEADLVDAVDGERFGTSSPSEAALLFLDDGRLLAIVRARGHCAVLATSSPPYRDWEYRRSRESRCYGADAARVGGRIVVTGRSFDNEGQRSLTGKFGKQGLATGVFLYDSDGGDLTIETLLESGGDTGYAAILPHGDSEALIAYYSSHEYADSPGSNIYLASVSV